MVNGPSIRVIDEKYYLSYYANGNNKFNGMVYAVSDNPFGPFEWGGTLISLGNTRYKGQVKPTDYVGNTHGGMVQLGDTWYQIYHRQTHNNGNSRQACVTPLKRNKDGSFEQAEYYISRI